MRQPREPCSSHARRLRDEALAVAQAAQAVDRGQEGAGAGLEDVGAQAAAADLAAAVIELDLHLALRLLTPGHGADAVVAERDFYAGQALDGGVDRVDGAVADRRVLGDLPVAVAQRDGGSRDRVR